MNNQNVIGKNQLTTTLAVRTLIGLAAIGLLGCAEPGDEVESLDLDADAEAIAGSAEPTLDSPEASEPSEDAQARAERHIEQQLRLMAETDYDLIVTPDAGETVVEYIVHSPGATASASSIGSSTSESPTHVPADRDRVEVPLQVVHPDIEAKLIELEPNDRIEVLLVLATKVALPRLPDLITSEPRESEANQIVLADRRARTDKAGQARAQERRAVLERVERLGGKVIEEFTFGNAAHVELSVADVRELALEPGVVHIEPTQIDTPPPDGFTDNDVEDARAQINSDTYFNHGADGIYRYIGLLDTGVRSTHVMFSSPNHLAFLRDCVNGGATCADTTAAGYDTDDTCWNHGTSTAAILVGSAGAGAAYRGVTNAWLDSWKVYGGCNGLDTTAVLRGFERSVYWGDKVIVAEMQPILGSTSSISAAADDAYDSGVMTIAANGNAGDDYYTVASPADAHKALGIGAYDVRSLATMGGQSRGPTDDLRYKPDLQLPTFTETASTACSNCLQVFGGTSGSTPYGAAAAMLVYDWFVDQSYGTDPGLIYTSLINRGDRSTFNDIQGAGHLQLGNLYCRRWMQGSRTISQGTVASVSFATVDTQKNLNVALWWPEEPGPHNRVILRVYDANNVLRASSSVWDSVKQKVIFNNLLTPAGNWRIEIEGASVTGSQQVFYQIYHEVSPYSCD